MSSQLDQSIQQQAQEAARAAQKAATKQPKVQTPVTTQFSEVMRGQTKGGSVKLMKSNPVAGSEVLKSAIGAKSGKGGKLSIAANANSSSGASGSTTKGSTTDGVLGATGTTSSEQMMAASQQMMEMNQDFNLQYLSLQNNMQAESRQYTALSNVSKTKSDTAKNSLSNVK
jgi:hypothetical protein